MPRTKENRRKNEYSTTGKLITPLDRALDKIVHGVAIITTCVNGKPYGMAAAWVTRASNEPYLVSVSVWKENLTHEKIQKSGVYAINILDESKKHLAIHFGRHPGRDVNKFEQIVYRKGKSGSPILYMDAVAYVDCQVIKAIEAGDHTILLGQVLQAEIMRPHHPMIYARKDYP